MVTAALRRARSATAVGEAAWRRLDRRAGTLDEAALRDLSPIVFLAPHPDDETLGGGGLLATASQLGLAPRVIYLTDGAASHVGSPAWPRARLALARRREALAALGELGVTEAATLFLGWPDAEPHAPNAPAYQETLSRLAAWLAPMPPKSLWAPWREEEHCDHQAASGLADDIAMRFPARRLDYVVWGWKSPGLEPASADRRCWRLACADRLDQRRRALARHRTQTTDLIADAETAFIIPPELAALADRPSEIFFEDEGRGL